MIMMCWHCSDTGQCSRRPWKSRKQTVQRRFRGDRRGPISRNSCRARHHLHSIGRCTCPTSLPVSHNHVLTWLAATRSNCFASLTVCEESGFIVLCLGIPVICELVIAYAIAYFAKIRISHILPHIMGFSKFRTFIYAFRIFIYP